MKTWHQILAGGASAALATACATTPIPADKLTRSSAEIAAAETLDAQRDPNAAVLLTMAKDELATGKRLLRDADYKRARGVLDRAEADAIAARELARAKSARLEKEKTAEEIVRQRAAIGGGQ